MNPLFMALRATPFILAATAAMGQQVQVPIPKGDGQAADCATSTVSGLDPNGDNFLAVRAGPGTQYAILDKLRSGQVVHTCAAQGGWTGIHYPGPGQRSGWVSSRYLTPLAG